MRGPSVAENRRLLGLLETALVREARLWKTPIFKSECVQSGDISSCQHQEMIIWLGDMNRRLHFCPETLALGVCILNRMLSIVKAQPKYLKCMAFTSLVLGAKMNEEDEIIGSVGDLVAESGCCFSTAEIVRMERIILDKLHWDLYTSTPVDFLHIFHALLVSGHPHLIPSLDRQKRPPDFHVALWTRQVQHCMACHQLWQFKGSTLALAIITLELEALTPDWFSVFTDLLKKAQVDSVEFIHCKESVDEHLRSLEFSVPANAVYIFDSAHIRAPARHPRQRIGKGQSADQLGDLDEYYDGLRHLYDEEQSADSAGSVGGSLFDSPHESTSPCPPLYSPS